MNKSRNVGSFPGTATVLPTVRPGYDVVQGDDAASRFSFCVAEDSNDPGSKEYPGFANEEQSSEL